MLGTFEASPAFWRQSMHGLHARRTALGLVLMLCFTETATAGDAGLPLPAAPRPLLVELFTSQGCSSCPPADAALAELAGRPDLLALAWHVDYWDGLGWKDPFSSADATRRQHDYARSRGFEVYTPQLVIDGQRAVVGSNREATAIALLEARAAASSVPARLRREGETLTIELGASSARPARGAIYLLSYEAGATTNIERGENAGRRIRYAHIVRSMRRIGDWTGEALRIREHLRSDEQAPGLALIVQDETATVRAVATAEMP